MSQVTAVIVTYNSRQSLPAAMAALAECHRAGLLECVIVDNASSDDTVAWVRSEHGWATVIAEKNNIGFGRGCNRGFEQCDTPYVLLLNPDAVLDGDAVRTLVTFMNGHQQVGLIAPAIREPDGQLQHAGGLPTPYSVVVQPLMPSLAEDERRFIEPGDEAFRTDWLCGAILMIRRAVLDQLGGFDPRFFLYFEETDLCRRALNAGWEIWAVGQAVGEHQNAGSVRTDEQRMFVDCIAEHYFQSRYYYLAKHHGRLIASAAEILELVAMAVRWGANRLRGKSYAELCTRLKSPILQSPPIRAAETGAVSGRTEDDSTTYHVVTADALSAELVETWSVLQAENEALRSPYFCPEFTLAVARVLDDVRVTLIERGGEAIGFFPFERHRGAVAKPVAGTLSDWHGVIAAPGTQFDAVELIRGSGCRIYDFDHVVGGQEAFRPFHEKADSSPFLDLSEGFDAYCEARRAAGSKKIRQIQRKARKMERELGAMRFEPDVQDPEVLDRVIEWKRAQCVRTGTYDYFGDDWTVRLVRELHRTRTPQFSGLLSALFLGDRVIAAHFGMLSGTTCHWWFPVYDDEFHHYSPGANLLLQLAEYVAGRGITVFDLGKGDDSYKTSFMTGEMPLAEGSVIVPSPRGALRRARVVGERWLRESWIGLPARVPLRTGLRLMRRLRP